MTDTPAENVTGLLAAWGRGDETALEKLVPLVHAELHRLAKRYMRRENQGHALQTTALVNEAYIRLIDWQNTRWENRAHFFGVSAQLMRHILVDFARKRPRGRDGTARQVTLEEGFLPDRRRSTDIIALDEALTSLARLDPRKSQIVEMRFFGGLSVEETAEVLKVAPITVIREWNKARAWLYRELSKGGASDDGICR